MPDFRTKIDINQSKNIIDYKSKIMMLGSCFTNSIGQYLSEYKFNVDINPFGVIYNPISIVNSIQTLIQNTQIDEEDLNYHNEQWFSYMHHSDFSNSDKEKCLNNINKRIKYSSDFLKTTDFLIITLGTARIYELKSTGEIVSNCHKIPASNFNRHLLSVKETTLILSDCITDLIKVNNNIKIIFTVSPVRHWKDGANGNQISKATLLLSIKELSERFSIVDYFPSYEILIDELRDYRFYKDDMLHPNNIAIDYILEKFLTSYTDKESRQIINKVEKLIKAKQHRVFIKNSESYKKFLEKHLELTIELKKKYPLIKLDEELRYFSSL